MIDSGNPALTVARYVPRENQLYFDGRQLLY